MKFNSVGEMLVQSENAQSWTIYNRDAIFEIGT